MSTIRDVAERAGVSTMTVSRVINNSGYSSQEARERVEAAIAELGYVPNSLARSLRFKRTKTLAFVLTDITNPFFTTLARGVGDAASKQGFNVIFCNTDESESEQAEQLTALVQKRVDGILLVPAASSAEAVAFLRDQKVPVVVFDRRVPDCSVDSVRCDSEEGAYQLVKLLLGLGHRRIGVLSGPARVSTAQDRVAGYRRALAEHGIPVEANLIAHGSFTQAGGYEMTQAMLGALTAAHRALCRQQLHRRRRLPGRARRRAARAGGCRHGGVRRPARLHRDRAFLYGGRSACIRNGAAATEILLERLTGEKPDAYQEILLPFEVIVRRSSGQPRDDAAARSAPQQWVMPNLPVEA